MFSLTLLLPTPFCTIIIGSPGTDHCLYDYDFCLSPIKASSSYIVHLGPLIQFHPYTFPDTLSNTLSKSIKSAKSSSVCLKTISSPKWKNVNSTSLQLNFWGLLSLLSRYGPTLDITVCWLTTLDSLTTHEFFNILYHFQVSS